MPALALGFFMIMVDTTIVNIAVPTLAEELQADYVAVGWVNSAYLLTYASLLLLTGRLGDRYGARAVFIVGLVVFTLTSLWCGLADSIPSLVAARAAQGVGAALMTPQTMAIITRVFPARQRGTALGVWGSVAGIATITGPVLGGVLVSSAGWKWIFWVNIPVGIVALYLALRHLPSLPTTSRRLDIVGVVLSILGLGAFVFGVQEGPTFDWGTIAGPISVPLMIGLGIALLAAFLVWQRRLGPNALLPLSLFTFRNFSLANIAGASVSFAMIGIFFPFTIFLQTVLGMSALEAALVNLPGSLLSGILAPFAGRLSDRIPGKWVATIGFATLSTSIAWMAFAIDPEATRWTFLPAVLLFGVGTGFVFSPLANLATSGLDQRTAGAGAGAFNTTRQMGGVIGSAVIVAVLTARLGHHLGGEAAAGVGAGGEIPADQLAAMAGGFASAVTETLLVAVGVLLLGLVAAIAMRATHVEHGAPEQGSPRARRGAVASRPPAARAASRRTTGAKEQTCRT